MIARLDKQEDAKKRLINDRITFNEANLQGINFIVDSDDITIKDLTQKIYDLYSNRLKGL